MHGFYLFPCQFGADPKERALVIFSSVSELRADDLEEQLRDYCDDKEIPNRIYIIASKADEESVRSAVNSDVFKNRLPSITRQLNTPTVSLLFFDADGKTRDEAKCRLIRRIGLVYLFRTRAGILEATSAYHYVKPSGRHCDKFLRTANVLVDGAEIDFIAFCCLVEIPEEVSHIYCDTGAISPIAYSIVSLKNRLSGETMRPSISSFGSYEGLKSFRFREPENSIVMLSASTSGSLVEELSGLVPGISADRFLTLFYLGEDQATGRVVCDLGYDQEENSQGLQPPRSFAAHECRLCADGSTPVQITGDHFLTEGVSVEPVLLRAADVPNWLSPFLSKVIGKGFILVNHAIANSTGATKEVFFDLESVYSSKDCCGIKSFELQFRRMIEHGISRSANRLLYLGDEGSREMALAVRSRADLGEDFPVLSLTEVEQDLKEHTMEAGLTIVIAGAIASGSTLLAASQVVRHIQKNGSVNYLVGLARTPDQGVLQEIRTNVTFGSRQDEHGFFLMDRVFLPVSRSGRLSPWDAERDLLIQLLEDELDSKTSDEIHSRVREIDESASSNEKGLRSDVFLRKTNGERLRLRPGFAFVDFDYPDGLTQSEVYFVIAAVMHRLRTHSGGKNSLSQHSHVRRVISPRCFERFNDGVIQSALLRCALGPEIDYSLSERLSNDMERFLGFVFKNHENESGEAAREFLLSIAQNKMKLRAECLLRLKNKFASSPGDGFLQALWRTITHSHSLE